MNVLFTISYKGTNYSGWQKQDNAVSIQEIIETAVFRALKQKVDLIASGRTDAGVHAIRQYANAKIDFPKIEKLPNAINPYLPDDIKIIEAKPVADDFNARFSAKRKTYLYKLNVSEFENPIYFDFQTTISQNLDLNKMQEAIKYIQGEHNFKSFCSSKTQTKDFVRTIFDIQIHKQNNNYEFYITGNGFLYNMVRIIVGVLIDVGTKKITPQDVKTILNNQDRKYAGKTMPAKGLYLYDVKYEDIE